MDVAATGFSAASEIVFARLGGFVFFLHYNADHFRILTVVPIISLLRFDRALQCIGDLFGFELPAVVGAVFIGKGEVVLRIIGMFSAQCIAAIVTRGAVDLRAVETRFSFYLGSSGSFGLSGEQAT